jgi:hypothetical protein
MSHRDCPRSSACSDSIDHVEPIHMKGLLSGPRDFFIKMAKFESLFTYQIRIILFFANHSISLPSQVLASMSKVAQIIDLSYELALRGLWTRPSSVGHPLSPFCFYFCYDRRGHNQRPLVAKNVPRIIFIYNFLQARFGGFYFTNYNNIR